MPDMSGVRKRVAKRSGGMKHTSRPFRTTLKSASMSWLDLVRTPRSFARRLDHNVSSSDDMVRLVGIARITITAVILVVPLLIGWVAFFPWMLHAVYTMFGIDPSAAQTKTIIMVVKLVVGALAMGALYIGIAHALVNIAVLRLPRPCCLRCGYDLSGTPGGDVRCPECGGELDALENRMAVDVQNSGSNSNVG